MVPILALSVFLIRCCSVSHNAYPACAGETMVSMGPKTLLACLLLTAFTLSGCSGGNETPESSRAEELAEGAPEIVVTETTGGIRGVVVDEAVRPIAGATVEVVGTDKKMVTDETGLFSFSGLEAGPYFIKASHPLYDVQQQSAEVAAGVANPAPVKILLTRVVLQDPYIQTLKYDGFIVCSANAVVPGVGGLLSEECGEGVGVPCTVPPPVGCQRVGGQGNNNVQFDFTIGAGAKTIIVEKAWEPTSDAGKALYSPIATEWSCLPTCSGNYLGEMDGESPIYAAMSNDTFEEEVVPDETIISVFTWASPSYSGTVLNQKYTDFVTVFYGLPAPEGWSLVNGDKDPYS
jgi:hypothetical protein